MPERQPAHKAPITPDNETSSLTGKLCYIVSMETLRSPLMPAPAVSTLESHLGYWLRAVSNEVSLSFAAKVAARGVSVAEWVLLRLLYDAPAPPSRIANAMGMTRGAITKLADKLIGKSLITRKASMHDGRAQTLFLTPQGTRLVPDLAALADSNDAAFFGYLTSTERKTLERLLMRMVEQNRITKTPVD